MPQVRYRNGLVLKNCWCSFCGARRTGKCFQEGVRWMLRMKECGHLGFRGYTAPVDVLEEKGLLNPQVKMSNNNKQRFSLEEERRSMENLERELWNLEHK